MSSVNGRNDVLIPHDIDYLCKLDGSIRLSEGLRLALLASRVKNGVIVEIGAFRGMSTCFLASGSQHGYGIPVFTIDCWDMRPAYREKEYRKYHPYDSPENKVIFDRQTLPYRELVHPIQGFASEVVRNWDKDIGLLFIDGHHDEAWQDYRNWSPFIQPGGFLVWHDANWRAVQKAIHRALRGHLWGRYKLFNSLYCVQRKCKKRKP
jgi:predicted O-methyltransferase YrrM